MIRLGHLLFCLRICSVWFQTVLVGLSLILRWWTPQFCSDQVIIKIE
jgi:hypothetical protein